MHLLKWLTLAGEAYLAVPLLGWGTVWSLYLLPAFCMFALHAICLVLAIRRGRPRKGNILGIITSLVSVLPVIGWGMHVATAIVLLVNLVNERKVQTTVLN